MKRVYSVVVALLMCLTSNVLASDEQIQDYTLYPYQSGFSLQEEFYGGGTTNGTIGNLGFGETNGTTSVLATASTSYIGIVRRDTSAVSGTITSLYLYPHSSSLFASNLPHDITWIVRLNTNDADTSLRIGAGNSVLTDPPIFGIYFEKDEADTNWFCVTTTAGVRTATDSGVAVNTSFNVFQYKRFSASVEYRINGALVCTNTTNLPTALVNPFTQIRNNAAASKTIDHDYFEVNIRGMTR